MLPSSSTSKHSMQVLNKCRCSAWLPGLYVSCVPIRCVYDGWEHRTRRTLSVMYSALRRGTSATAVAAPASALQRGDAHRLQRAMAILLCSMLRKPDTGRRCGSACLPTLRQGPTHRSHSLHPNLMTFEHSRQRDSSLQIRGFRSCAADQLLVSQKQARNSA